MISSLKSSKEREREKVVALFFKNTVVCKRKNT
jgi:hypothetical protein